MAATSSPPESSTARRFINHITQQDISGSSSPCPPFWEFFERPRAQTRCIHAGSPHHRRTECCACLQQKIAYEVFTGGATSRTFMQLSLAYDKGVELGGSPKAEPLPAWEACGDAQARDLKSALLFCAVGTYRAHLSNSAKDLEVALEDLKKAMDMDDSLLLATYSLACVYDMFASTPVKGSTRSRTTCLHKAREYYETVDKRLAGADQAPIQFDIVKSRLRLLKDYDLEEYLPSPQLAPVPEEWLQSYIRKWKDPEGEVLCTARFEALAPELGSCVRSVLEDAQAGKGAPEGCSNTAKPKKRKSKRVCTQKAVDRELVALLQELRGKDGPPVSRRTVRQELLQYFLEEQQKTGSIVDAFVRAGEFFYRGQSIPLKETWNGERREEYKEK